MNIIYFTAGFKPTSGEAADIAALNNFCTNYTLTVSNGSVAPNLGRDGNGALLLDDASYVAGTVPSIYSELPVIDPANPFATAIGDDKVIVTDADDITLDGKVYTFTVEDGAITAIAVADEV
jgi:hypothetical protein